MKKGFTARVKEVAPHEIFQHCIIHREALEQKNYSQMSTEYCKMLSM
jgi:hypothetical protein